MKIKQLKANEKGLTLVELLASFVILSIIFFSILSILNLSAKANRQSEDMMDATYLAQEEMEWLYTMSRDGKRIAKDENYRLETSTKAWKTYTKNSDLEGIVIKVKENDTNFPMVRVLIHVYDEKEPEIVKAQMESFMKWGQPNDAS